jgi:tRNA nucleotidyltransferase (CCA-adding enzyme)
MNSRQYLSAIIKKYSVLDEEYKNSLIKIRPLRRELRRWGNQYIKKIIPSGSYVKGTAIKGTADIDLMISFKNQAPFTLKEIYESLYDFLSQSYSAKKQNVSVGVVFQGTKVDLVPAKKQPNVTHPHSIYVSKQDTWTKTNVNKHINLIKNSPHRNAIKLLKIWCKLNELDFPSFVLEMTVLEALKKKRALGIDKKFISILKYIIEEFENAKIYDPANTNNNISDTISNEQKDSIIQAALASYGENFWETIIWGLFEK